MKTDAWETSSSAEDLKPTLKRTYYAHVQLCNVLFLNPELCGFGAAFSSSPVGIKQFYLLLQLYSDWLPLTNKRFDHQLRCHRDPKGVGKKILLSIWSSLKPELLAYRNNSEADLSISNLGHVRCEHPPSQQIRQ